MKIIDREHELRLFESLLTFETQLRILAVKVGPGHGKSYLLEKLRRVCEQRRPRQVPVSLISLKDLADRTPFMFAKELVEQLARSRMAVPLPSLARYRLSQSRKEDMSRLIGSVQATVSLDGADMQGAEMHIEGASIHINLDDQHATMPLDELTFLDDLRRYADENPVVILLDAYDKGDDDLSEWLRYSFLEPLFFNLESRPRRILLVIAGQWLPDFDNWWPPEETQVVVQLVERLSRWEQRHIEDFLRAYDLPVNINTIGVVSNLLDMNMPLDFVDGVIQELLSRRVQP